ncbi:hypothetical protein G7Y79_00038g074410 [Physcia stellaris]|nr:hypothetical protein G7Y79_00038g074410 [Physcia stellaris]
MVHASTIPQAAQQAPLDVVKVGNYDIYNCGPLARNISDQMLALQSVLRPALADAKNFTFPSPAYTTFFKVPQYAPFVASILSQTTQGALVLPGNVLPNENIPPSPPMLACAIDPAKNPNIHQEHDRHHWGLLTRLTAFAYTYCNSSATNRAAAIGGTPFIAICPYHFSLPMLPEPDRCMLQRKSTGEYLESGATFANTMVAGLLHEIVHYYANAAVPPTKSPEDDKEVYYVNDLSKLESDFLLLRLQICTSFVSSPDSLHFAEHLPKMPSVPELTDKSGIAGSDGERDITGQVV